MSEEAKAADEIVKAESILYAVCTVTEASRKWRKSETAIKLQCEKGNLDARHSGHHWLITMESLERLWGLPYEPDYDW